MNLTQALYAVLIIALAVAPQVLALVIAHYADRYRDSQSAVLPRRKQSALQVKTTTLCSQVQ